MAEADKWNELLPKTVSDTMKYKGRYVDRRVRRSAPVPEFGDFYNEIGNTGFFGPAPGDA